MSATPQFVLRARTPLEALDLGLRLLQAHRGPVYRVVLLQLGVLLAIALPFTWRQPAWCLLWLWGLLPWLDRGTLHVLSRRVFGQPAGVFTFLEAFREVHRHGLAASLLWRRLSPGRSFLLPIWQLEHQGGKGYRARARVLSRQGGGTAFLLGGMTFLLTGLTLFGVLGLLQMLTPRVLGLDLWQGLGQAFGRPWFNWAFTAFGLLAILATRPFYAAAGFALYLNRRTQLEGWDLEQAFRAMASRLAGSGRVLALLAALLLAPGLRAQAPPAPAQAEEGAADAPRHPQDPARQQVERLLKEDPDLRRTRAERKLRYRPNGQEPSWLRRLLDWLFLDEVQPEPSSHPSPAWWRYLALALKAVLVTGLIGSLLYLLARYRGARLGRLGEGAAFQAPEAILGLDLRPETLPANLHLEALGRFRDGDPRGALALLYRGALAFLVREKGLRVPPSATEGDCLRAALPALEAEPGQTLRTLTRVWIRMAYLGEAPAGEIMEDLCARWPAAFGGQP